MLVLTTQDPLLRTTIPLIDGPINSSFFCCLFLEDAVVGVAGVVFNRLVYTIFIYKKTKETSSDASNRPPLVTSLEGRAASSRLELPQSYTQLVLQLEIKITLYDVGPVSHIIQSISC